MFGTSAAFHRLRWSAPAWRRMRRADHSAIFVGIAATSTAVAGLALTGWAEVLVLSHGLGRRPRRDCAAPGVPRRAAVGSRHPLRGRGLVSHHRGAPAGAQPGLGRLRADAGGGGAYTAGALVYARKWPDPWPRVFGFHEVFHACTLVGAGLFAYLVAFIALPRY